MLVFDVGVVIVGVCDDGVVNWLLRVNVEVVYWVV